MVDFALSNLIIFYFKFRKLPRNLARLSINQDLYFFNLFKLIEEGDRFIFHCDLYNLDVTIYMSNLICITPSLRTQINPCEIEALFSFNYTFWITMIYMKIIYLISISSLFSFEGKRDTIETNKNLKLVSE